YLVTDHSPTLDLQAWQREWGVGDPEEVRGGVVPPQPEPPIRDVTLLQRKAEKPGRGLGKTTGWIHRAQLQRKNVRMIGGVSYDHITPEGLWVTVDGAAQLIEADTIVLCAGQISRRSLADDLIA